MTNTLWPTPHDQHLVTNTLWPTELWWPMANTLWPTPQNKARGRVGC